MDSRVCACVQCVRSTAKMSNLGLDPWWECDLCDVFLDMVGPLLVEPAEWERRRQIQHERKALLALTGLWLGALFGASLMVVPSMVWALGSFVLLVLHYSVSLLVFLYAPLMLMAILLGVMTS